MQYLNKQRSLAGSLCVALSLMTPATQANAQTWSVGAGVVVDQSAYKDYKTEVTGFPLVTYQGKRVFLEGTKAGVHLINTQPHQLDVNIEFAGENFKASKSDDYALKRLDNRKVTLMAGLGYRYRSNLGDFSLNFAVDTLGRNKGATSRIGYMYPLQMDKLRVELGGGLNWESSKYNQYYYGISAKEAYRSGLKAHKVGSTLTPDLSIHAHYAVNDKWQIFAVGSVKWLGSQAKNSPMIERSYSSSAGVGFLYSF